MKSFEDQYAILNTKQKQAVDTIDGPVFVMAGPGTGKTQILTLRIANILKQGSGIDPENILALTFTNAAAYNMRERLSKIIGAQEAHRAYIATFHSFAEDMIKRYPQYFERFISSRLVSPVEQIEIIHDLADRFGGKNFSVFKRRSGTLKSISFSLGKIKNEGLNPEEFRKKVQEKFDEDVQSPDMFYKRAYGTFKKGDLKESALRTLEARRDKTLALADIYEAYEKELVERDLYDYNDLIASLVFELRNDSLFQTELQEQFQYILVDEHQDTNDGQNAILHSLLDNPVWEGKPNVFVVGDAKQSIFRFAGASQKSFTELFEKIPAVTTIELENNYRSHQRVLDHAQNLITKSDHHKEEPQLEAHFDYSGNIEYREFHSYKTEALWVAQDIKSRIENGEEASQMAILFRNNNDAADLRILLDVYGISYQDLSKKNLLEDPDMLKLFLLLRCVYNSTDDEVVAKALFIDFLGLDIIGAQKVLKAYRNQRKAHVSLFEMIAQGKKLKELELSEDEMQRYDSFVSMLVQQKSDAENKDFVTFFSDFIRESGFLRAMLGKPDSALALAKIETLFDEVKKEQSSRAEFSFEDFIIYLNTLKEHNITMSVTAPMNQGVQLMTFHGSKGLEFDTVYIVRALKKRAISSEISLPFDDFSSGNTEDERRLLYVAMTRAKKNCLMSSYVYNHEGKEQSRSIHINEVDELPHVDMTTWEEENTHLFADYFGASQGHLVSLVDQEYIQERFLATKLSVSALNNYMQSPLLYFFRNLVLLPQSRSPFLEFGNLIHGTLEDYFENTDVQELDITQLKTSYEKIKGSHFAYQDYDEKGWELLENYAQHYQIFDRPLENEFRIPALSFESDSGHTINLTGVVDKVTREEDGSITVWDYKTGRSYSGMDKGRKEKIKRQATFYKLLLQNSFDGRYNPSKIIFDFLEPSEKTGKYERQEFEITQEDVEELKKEINLLINDVLEGSLLKKDFVANQDNKELLSFLEVLKGPRTYEQPTLL